ncbi:MAG: DUF4292 domain-containing protein [Saprospiraceae bacterium]
MSFSRKTSLPTLPRLLAGLGFFLILTAAQSTCSSKKSAASNASKPATEARSVDFLQKKLADNSLKNVERLSAKAKIAVDQDGSMLNVSANLIWVKDSMLWLNVRKFGIEGARALITRDSVFVLNRLEKTVSVKSWDWLRREYNLPEGFSLLENVVLARAWFDPGTKLAADIRDSLHRISGTNGRFSADYRIEESSFRLRKMTFLEPKDSRAVTFGFEGYEKISGASHFPYLRTVEAFSPEDGATRLEIELSDVEINVPKNWRFEIPSHYKRVD